MSSQPQELPPGVTPLRRAARRRRAEVLRAAAELFAEKGYEASSTTELAERLGIKGGSVYYYIDSKEELLFELVEDICCRPGIWPNWRSSGAVIDEVTTSGLAPG